MVTPSELEAELNEVLAYEWKLKREDKLSRFLPYPKQFAFYEEGAANRERLLMAGNQVGKTYSAGYEVAIHATGLYPDWWTGKKFDRPVLIWTGSETNESSKAIIQPVLLGTSDPSLGGQDMGTGSIPRDHILNVTTRQAGVKGVADEITVRHVNGGNSLISLKTYEQDRPKWQGVSVDVIWPDEEPPADLYSEAVTRTQATGGIVLVTFTPLKGMSTVVSEFLEGESPMGKGVTNMTIYDAVGGVWPEGTPWAGETWIGHYTQEEADLIVASYPDHERDTRAKGVPMMGEGRVWPVEESTISVPAIEIPPFWFQIAGCDFGWDHPAAGARLAWDRDNDVVYLTDCYKRSGETPVYHASKFKAWGQWLPVAWPHDGLNTEKASGKVLKDEYARHGANMMYFSARYDDKKGGRQDVEPSVLDLYERMRTGRFKAFAHLEDFWEEFRMYHRKDGKIVPRNDDIISALRYGSMMLRYAAQKTGPRLESYQGPLVTQFG